ncbi:MAG: hypothetical protein B7C24_07725 [Bacteroidetes bacterium 4572_77]|nr:MAG: hypothetical protein B7C24_07725 [Bacteroidetes bacterium 4572_77]
MKNLKFLWISLLALIIMSSCNMETKSDSYTISGEIIGATTGEVQLKTRSENGYINLDSASLIDGKFTMQGKVEQTKFAYLTSKIFKGGIPIFVENGKISIVMHIDSAAKAVVSGSQAQDIYTTAKEEMAAIDELWQDYYYNTFKYLNDEEKAKSESYLNSIYDSATVLKKTYITNYLTSNDNSAASAQLLLDNEDALGSEAMLKIFETLSPLALASSSGEFLSSRVAIMKTTAIGQSLVDFTMNDTKGNPISLSEATKGKYVLVDFWAAWCSPCRRENPNVVANYQKYHDKGFDVFGVSFDENKDNWLKAIEDDGLTWMQVSDLKGWQNAAGKLYGIRSIPQNLLLSPEGIILAKNLRGEALGEKLSELLD